MNSIKRVSNPDPSTLEALGIFQWPIWEKEISKFPWTYEAEETCYLLSGKVIVTPENGESVTIIKGDLVTFPAGMSCTWEVLEDIKKHYRFSSI